MSFTEGKFDYTVQRPNVPGLNRFAGRALNVTEALRLQRNFGLLAKGLNAKTVTIWGVGRIGTDHSYLDTKTGKHFIVADPRRLSQPDRVSAPQSGLPRLTNANVASVTGAVIHEVAHTLYTPKIAKLSAKELAVFRVYEDAYINAYILAERLPGATSLLQYAFNWSNPRPELQRGVAQAVAQWEKQPTFKSAIQVLGNADFIARITNANGTVRVPNASLVALLNKVQPITDRLSAGTLIEWPDRLKLYRKVAKVIDSFIVVPEADEPEPEHPEGGEPDADGESQQPQPGEGEPVASDPDPDDDTSSDDWDDEGNEEEAEEPSQTGDGTDGAPQPESEPDTADDEEDEDDDLDDTYGDDAEDTSLECEETHPRQERGQTGSSLNETLARANHATLATDEDGVTLSNDGLYEKALPGQYTVRGINQQRIDELTKVFKAKSNVRRAVVHGLDEGRISGRRLGKLVSGTSKNVFKARPVFKQASAAVLLLVDGSGSMAGANYDGAALAAYELFASLNGNVDYSVYAWVYTGSSSLNIVGASLDGKVLAWPRDGGGSTPSHEAMVEAAKFLKKRHGDVTRLIVHFTDLGYTDRPTAEFNALERERGLSYASVSVTENPNHFALALEQSRRASPNMKVSGYTSNQLVEAVQELVAKTF